jgi:hypothetical protein
MSKHHKILNWEDVLSSACRLQQIIPNAVLAGGTAVAAHISHRFSYDADHVLTNLKSNFKNILTKLENVAGWNTKRLVYPHIILENFYGIATGIRQLIRQKPLETETINLKGYSLVVPTLSEILRIKAVLIIQRNSTRDYLDFAALSDHLNESTLISSLLPFDELYPQKNGCSALQQLYIQLSNPLPSDLDRIKLHEYKGLIQKYQDWDTIKNICMFASTHCFKTITQIKRMKHDLTDSPTTKPRL